MCKYSYQAGRILSVFCVSGCWSSAGCSGIKYLLNHHLFENEMRTCLICICFVQTLEEIRLMTAKFHRWAGSLIAKTAALRRLLAQRGTFLWRNLNVLDAKGRGGPWSRISLAWQFTAGWFLLSNGGFNLLSLVLYRPWLGQRDEREETWNLDAARSANATKRTADVWLWTLFRSLPVKETRSFNANQATGSLTVAS